MNAARHEQVSRLLVVLGLLAAIIVLLIGSAKAADRNSKDEGCLPPAVSAALDQVRAMCGPIKVLSTSRPGARVIASDANGNVRRVVPSLHDGCYAADFRPVNCGCAYRALKSWRHGLSLDCGAMRHIHLSAPGPRDEGRFVHHRGGSQTLSATPRVDLATQGALR